MITEKKVNIGSLLLEWGICGVYVGPSVSLTINSNDIAVEIIEKKDNYTIEQISELHV